MSMDVFFIECIIVDPLIEKGLSYQEFELLGGENKWHWKFIDILREVKLDEIWTSLNCTDTFCSYFLQKNK